MSQTQILGISYCGTRYKGWQRQLNPVFQTVQGELERALSLVANHPVSVICAGRTDAGVHATQQVVHFQSPSIRPLKAWVQGVNTHLPDDVRVMWAKVVESQEPESEEGEQGKERKKEPKKESKETIRVDYQHSFHARFSATARSYRYVWHNQAVASALYHGMVTPFAHRLDAERMHQEAQALLGEQDFTSFRASGCQSRTAMRNVHAVSVKRSGDWVYLDITANAFLLHMVRNIAGFLMAVGQGKLPKGELARVLALKDRTQAEITAPAAGLYLIGVDYPMHFDIPSSTPLPPSLGDPIPFG